MSSERKTAGLLVTALALPAVMCLSVLALRVSSVAGDSGRILSTSGGESVSIYNVMKAARGLKLYEDPRFPPYYPTTLYNAGFYRMYGEVAWAFGGGTGRLVLASRLLTFAFACVGLIGLLLYALGDLLRRSRCARPVAVGLLMTLIAIPTLLGTVPGWWLLTVRPDVGAAAFGALALALVFWLGPERERAAGISGGICLAVAWSFKQSCVLIFVGLVIAAVVQKRYRFLAALSVPLLVVGFVFAVLLGPDYRYNAFFATSLSGFSLKNLFHLVIRLATKGAFPLAVSLVALRSLPSVRWLRPDERAGLTACWWTTLIGGLVTCCRNGSELNYFFELWAVTGFLSVILARQLIEGLDQVDHRRSLLAWGLTGVAICSAGLDASRLASSGKVGSVRLTIAPDRLEELERARAFASRFTGAVYFQPALSGLAWDLSFPAYVFDDYPYYHAPAVKRGLLRGDGPMGLVRDHYFSVMVIENSDATMLDAAVQAGYVRQAAWSQVAVLTPPAVAPPIEFSAR